MLTAWPRPGLTNHSQISASHVPLGGSLELILASADPEWWVSVQHVHVWVFDCMFVSVLAEIVELTDFPMLPGSPRTPARPLCP